jgi:hypothetical protein
MAQNAITNVPNRNRSGCFEGIADVVSTLASERAVAAISYFALTFLAAGAAGGSESASN